MPFLTGKKQTRARKQARARGGAGWDPGEGCFPQRHFGVRGREEVYTRIFHGFHGQPRVVRKHTRVVWSWPGLDCYLHIEHAFTPTVMGVAKTHRTFHGSQRNTKTFLPRDSTSKQGDQDTVRRPSMHRAAEGTLIGSIHTRFCRIPGSVPEGRGCLICDEGICGENQPRQCGCGIHPSMQERCRKTSQRMGRTPKPTNDGFVWWSMQRKS